MKVGATCFCLGEAQDVFTVVQVLNKAAVLNTAGGYAHGTESFSKLYKTLDELERRTYSAKKVTKPRRRTKR